MKKSMLNVLGLAGVVSFVSYAVAVIFSPLTYPGYDWLRQAENRQCVRHDRHRFLFVVLITIK